VEWFDKRRSEKVGSGAHARTDVYSGYCSGLPLRIKEINMASMIKVLLVQPYDIMGSVLIEYD
jgi:hypothetical protein